MRGVQELRSYLCNEAGIKANVGKQVNALVLAYLVGPFRLPYELRRYKLATCN